MCPLELAIADVARDRPIVFIERFTELAGTVSLRNEEQLLAWRRIRCGSNRFSTRCAYG